jgi:hypothetical protein
MAGYEGITAGYLIRSDRPCLVETGTAPSAPVVRDALAALGIGPGDLATVVVTHIHLDHAGGAGDIAAMFPAAQIVVHQRGARHLADPSRLMAGARMVYGRALERLFGVLAPVPAERIVALDDIATVDLGGGRRLDSYYSPGHAKHHVGLVDSDTGDLYVGEASPRLDQGLMTVGPGLGAVDLVFVLICFEIVVLFEVVELDAVELVQALGCVGLAVGVGPGGAGERIPGFAFAPGGQQRVRVGVEQPGGPGSYPTAGQLGDLQRQDGGVGQALVAADARFDDTELNLRGPVQRGGIRLTDQSKRPVQPAESALAVGHDGQVVVLPGHSSRSPKLRQRFGPPLGPVGGDAAGLPDHTDTSGQAFGGLSVLVALLGVLCQTGRH